MFQLLVPTKLAGNANTIFTMVYNLAVKNSLVVGEKHFFYQNLISNTKSKMVAKADFK